MRFNDMYLDFSVFQNQKYVKKIHLNDCNFFQLQMCTYLIKKDTHNHVYTQMNKDIDRDVHQWSQYTLC